MSTYNHLILPLTLAMGLSSTFVASAQQPDARPAPQSDSGWRKFNDSRAADQYNTNAPAANVVRTAVPAQVIVPAGTWITIRVDDVISTNRNVAGDGFSATLAQPLIADGLVVARRGQRLAGRVAEVDKGGKVKGTSHLGLELNELSLVDGRQVPVRAELIKYSAGTSHARDATAVAATTGTGAAIGAMAAGGPGAAVGALAGAAASTIGVLVTRGHPTEVYPEAAITFRLTEPLIVSTAHAAWAFRAAGQPDYETHLDVRSQGPATSVVHPAPAPAPLYWGLGYGYGYGYPYYYAPYWYGPSFAYYGGAYYRGGYYAGRYYGGGHYAGHYGGGAHGGGHR